MTNSIVKRGVILAGGSGTRLHPLTIATNKQLLPLYDKPIIFYPLQTLKDMGYEEILIISGNLEQEDKYKKLLGDGSDHGLKLEYRIQTAPRGLADAFIVGRTWLMGADEICLILGDNIFITNTPIKPYVNTIYSYEVDNPSQYGVAIIDKNGYIEKIVEKPKEFVSNDAIVGLYVFDNRVLNLARDLKPSERGELEIVDLIKEMDKLFTPIKVEKLDGFWFDVGDVDSLLDCANLVRTINKRSTRKLGL